MLDIGGKGGNLIFSNKNILNVYNQNFYPKFKIPSLITCRIPTMISEWISNTEGA